MGVLFIYYTQFAPPVPTQVESSDKTSSTGIQVPTAAPVSAPVSSIAQHLEIKSSSSSLQNEEAQVTFSHQKAVLSQWVLKKFTQTVEKDSPLTDLIGEGGGVYFTTGQQDLDQELAFESKGDGLFQGQSSRMEVSQKWDVGKAGQNYLSDLTVKIKNTGTEPLTLSPGTMVARFQKVEPKRSGGFFALLGAQPDIFEPYFLENGSLVHAGQWAKLSEKQEKAGNISWSGISDRYFLLSVIARQDSGSTVQYGKTAEGRIFSSLSYGTSLLQPGESIEKKFSVYIGPKERSELKKLGVGLEKSVDYGWFSSVAIGLLWLLQFFHKLIPNWGVAIILLTFFVKLLLHPVNVKAMKSMKAMQKIQPELKGLQEKYSKDRERLNVEMMALFKRHQVNPAGGCLPMLLQMPIYIALYRVLFNAIELYHAPFFGFYKDLSAPDPYLIAPIILGICMVLQQKLTPTASADPVQKQMMTIMPLMFSVFMIFLPVGLVFYILVNTLMSVIQQYMMHNDITGMDLFRKYVLRRA